MPRIDVEVGDCSGLADLSKGWRETVRMPDRICCRVCRVLERESGKE